MKMIFKIFVFLSVIILIQGKAEAISKKDIKKVPLILKQALLDSISADKEKIQVLEDIIAKATKEISSPLYKSPKLKTINIDQDSVIQIIIFMGIEQTTKITKYLSKNIEALEETSISQELAKVLMLNYISYIKSIENRNNII